MNSENILQTDEEANASHANIIGDVCCDVNAMYKICGSSKIYNNNSQ